MRELVDTAAAKIGARVETVPSIRPTSDGCTICRTKSSSEPPVRRRMSLARRELIADRRRWPGDWADGPGAATAASPGVAWSGGLVIESALYRSYKNKVHLTTTMTCIS